MTEANRERRNLVLSHRAVMEREREEKRGKLLEELAVGQLREGIVRSIKDFGAFVDLGGADGLIHVSQLSWDRVNHPSEVLEVGQKVKVRVEKFDKDTGKISLSYREVGENPWEKAASKYYVGARVSGVVSRLMDFGAFVKLEPGVEGLGSRFGAGLQPRLAAERRAERRPGSGSEGALGRRREAADQPVAQGAAGSAGEGGQENKCRRRPAAAGRRTESRRGRRINRSRAARAGPSGGEKFGLNW